MPEIGVVKLTKTDPYEMGKEHGQIKKKEIHLFVDKVLTLFRQEMLKQNLDPLKEGQQLLPHIPKAYLDEMRGIADGAEISFDNLLVAHTFSDTCDLFACSVLALTHDPKTDLYERLCATNYFASIGQKDPKKDIDESFRRYNDLDKHSSSTSNESLKAALLKVNYADTLQSIVFDGRDIHLATASDYAANTAYTTFKGDDLFGKTAQTKTTEKIVKLARNLDWPLPLIARETFILVRPAHNGNKATAIVALPGAVGAFSGVNEEGTSMAITIVPSSKQIGTPCHFMFRQILEKTTKIKDADKVVSDCTPAASWNLVVAATDGIGRYELDPVRSKKGAAHVAHGNG